MTEVSFAGEKILIDGQPTYAGRTFEGHEIEGLLFNVRAVQAIFDDANPATRQLWSYPDTGRWDPERNVQEFCDALPTWRRRGILGFTVNLQGGGPTYTPEVYHAYDNNGFTPQGQLKPAYARRLARVLGRADELGMVAIVGFFYWIFLRRMEDEEALWRAADETLAFLEGTGHQNVLIEIANEIDVVVDNTRFDILRPDRVHEMINGLRADHPGFLYSTSGGGAEVDTGRGMPPPSLVSADDFVLLHGNGLRPPQLAAAIQAVCAMPAFQENPKPIIINEDSPAIGNFEAAWHNGASWGYYDQGWQGQGTDPYEDYVPRPRGNEGPFEELSGFQTPPVNWGINTPFKKAFFERVAEVTGADED